MPPSHLDRGRTGETAARHFLTKAGLCFLTANYRGRHGEIDIVFRDRDCLVFVEVKTRSHGQWTRPAAAVDGRKRRLLSLTAEEYVRSLPDPRVKWRFDIIEVLIDEREVIEIRHLVNAFTHDTRARRRP